MMNTGELIDWLIATGGPTVKYRTIAELADNSPNPDNVLGDLLHVKAVASLLESLECYEPIQNIDIRTFNAIHNGAGVEGIVAKLIELGMRSGIGAFDSRMQVFRQYVDNELVTRALSSPCGQDVADNRAIFTAVLMASYFIHSGYEYEEIISFIKKRIDLLYKAASEKQFDIHLSDAELLNYPKRPKCWTSTPVVRPEYDPGGSEKPLPLIHDIFCLSYLPEAIIDNDLRNKTDKIIEYVLEESFQALPTGYGLVYYKKNRTFYGMGWRPVLPCLHNFDSEYETGTLVLYMELMANFEAARKSAWFNNCLSYLEQFKTSNGTYCFPRAFLKEIKNSGHVCGTSMGLEENRRQAKAYEIESTFRMLLIKKGGKVI